MNWNPTAQPLVSAWEADMRSDHLMSGYFAASLDTSRVSMLVSLSRIKSARMGNRPRGFTSATDTSPSYKHSIYTYGLLMLNLHGSRQHHYCNTHQTMEDFCEQLFILNHLLSKLPPLLFTVTHQPLLHQSPDVLHHH